MSKVKQRRLTVSAVTLGVAAAMMLAGCSATGANGSGAKPDHVSIALSNSYLGNSWRQTMVKAFTATAKQAKQDGDIDSYSVSNTSQNTATEQIAQIKSLILKRPSAIVINSASPTALNGVITQACSAGIKVVVFDSLASAKCEYNVVDGLKDVGYQEAKLVAEAMGGKGNLLMVRGIVGSAPEQQVHSGQLEALKQYPGIKIVKSIVGQASDSVTQQAVQSVLPSLPTINGVVTGGASYGALQAFQAAGKPLPHAAFDNSGQSLQFWQQLRSSQNYKAGSVRSDPGQASAAIWVALQLVDGKKVPKTLLLPNVVISDTDLAQWLKVTPTNNVAAWLWTKQQTQKAIADNLAGKKVPAPPIPTAAP